MADASRTPFNILHAITLPDFARAELSPLAEGLRATGGASEAMVDEVFAWTAGHPYLSQVVCQDLAGQRVQAPGEEAALVKDVVERRFLQRAHELNVNLSTARDRLDVSSNVGRLLELYKQVLRGDVILADAESEIQAELRLTGMVANRAVDGQLRLQVRNRIFATVFSEAWIEERERRRPLTAQLRRWVASGKEDRTLLLQGSALREAQAWATEHRDVTAEERELIEKSIGEEGRRRLFFWLGWAAAGMMVPVAVLLGAYLLAQQKLATKATIDDLRAESAARGAEVEQKKAEVSRAKQALSEVEGRFKRLSEETKDVQETLRKANEAVEAARAAEKSATRAADEARTIAAGEKLKGAVAVKAAEDRASVLVKAAEGRAAGAEQAAADAQQRLFAAEKAALSVKYNCDNEKADALGRLRVEYELKLKGCTDSKTCPPCPQGTAP